MGYGERPRPQPLATRKMPEHDRELNDLSARLAQRASAGMSSAEISEVILDAWVRIGVALTPIVGTRAIALLRQRTLLLTAEKHPFLSGAPGGLPEAADLDALKRLLERQSGAQAVVGGGALLQTLLDLLASLVGSSLTERLLRSVWANLLSGLAAKDFPA